MSCNTLIIGAGSAGCVLAARLSEDPDHRVILLEAGPDFDPTDMPEQVEYLGRGYQWPIEWGEEVESSDGRVLPYLRGRGVGGSSSINGGVAMRAEPPDLAVWPKGWQWEDMLPWFRHLEQDREFGDADWHGDAGPVPIIRWAESDWDPTQRAFYEACVAESILECPDHNAPDTTGVGPIPMNRDDKRRLSAALTHLAPARSRGNLEVRGDALIQRIVFEGNAAKGVELVGGETLHADRVIVAAGVLQSPLILWRSGVGPADALRALGIDIVADRPRVGAHWTDHMVIQLSIPIDAAHVRSGARGIQTLARLTADSTGGGEPNPYTNDVQITPWTERTGKSDYQLNLSISLQQPFGEARIAAPSADPSIRGLFKWPFPEESKNVARLRFGYRQAARILARTGLSTAPEVLKEASARTDEELDDWIAENHGAFYHGVGSCRMGDDDEAVTDLQCAVRGTDGLYVIDASTIPRVPRSNTHILVVALAERAAALLRGETTL